MKILIVEDERALKDTIQKFLEAEHFIVEYAENYSSGLEKNYFVRIRLYFAGYYAA